MNGAVITDLGETISVFVPVQWKRRGGRKEIVLPEEPPPEPEAAPTPLQIALARAFHWQRMIDEGEVEDIAGLAEKVGFDRSYVGRTLELAGLAPDIIEAVLAGQEPSGLSLRLLHQGLPYEWRKQREVVGVDRGFSSINDCASPSSCPASARHFTPRDAASRKPRTPPCACPEIRYHPRAKSD